MGCACIERFLDPQKHYDEQQHKQSLLTDSDRTTDHLNNSFLSSASLEKKSVFSHASSNSMGFSESLQESIITLEGGIQTQYKEIKDNVYIQDKNQPRNIEQEYQEGLIKQRHAITQQDHLDEKQSQININTNHYPYDCIGLIKVKYVGDPADPELRQKIGSGFLIGPNLVLTAAHNVINASKRPYQEIRFYPKVDGYINSDDEMAEVNKVYILPNYSHKQDSSKDFALLRLQRPIQRERFIMLGQNYPFGGQRASVYGYPAVSDVSNGIFRQYGGSGPIISIHNQIVQYKILTKQGQSGSPLIVELVEGLFFAVGIHNKSNHDGQLKYGLHLSNNKLEVIRNWVRDIDCQSKFIVADFAQIKILSNVVSSGVIRKSNITPQIDLYLKLVETESRDPLKQCFLLVQVGRKFRLRLNYEDSLNRLNRAQELYKKSDAPQLDIAHLYYELGNTYMEMKKYSQACYYLQNALNTFKSLDDKISTVKALKSITNCYIKLQKFKSAEDTFSEAFQLDRVYIDKSPKKLIYYQSLIAYIYHYNKKYKKAQQLYQRVILRKNESLKEDIQLSKYYYSLANVQIQLAQLDQSKLEASINGYYKALKIMIRLGKVQHYKFAKFKDGFQKALKKTIKYKKQLQISVVQLMDDLQSHNINFGDIKQTIYSAIQTRL